MSDDQRSRRVLEPHERISEVLFGLIMVLTFTGSLSVAEARHEDVRTMLIGALGCNLAWGIIDAILYLMGSLAERGRNLQLLKAVRAEADAARARRLIADALPAVVTSVLEPAELEALHRKLAALPEPPRIVRLRGSEWAGALGVFLLVFLSTFPVAVPFMLTSDVARAMRQSNGVAVAMLLVAGIAYGRTVGRSPWLFGFAMVALGGALVAMTIALGG
jgi:VIT1/CCC1 family predicted Fe2+/Mn2+ transporter